MADNPYQAPDARAIPFVAGEVPADAHVLRIDATLADRHVRKGLLIGIVLLGIPPLGALWLLRVWRQRPMVGAIQLWFNDREIAGIDETGRRPVLVRARRTDLPELKVHHGDGIGFRTSDGIYRIVPLHLVAAAERSAALTALGLRPFAPIG